MKKKKKDVGTKCLEEEYEFVDLISLGLFLKES